MMQGLGSMTIPPAGCGLGWAGLGRNQGTSALGKASLGGLPRANSAAHRPDRTLQGRVDGDTGQASSCVSCVRRKRWAACASLRGHSLESIP